MKKTVLYLLLVLLSAWPLHAQSTAAASVSGMQIRFGQAMIPLTGPWKFHIGDDPRWADPKFDDSAWGTMDLTPKAVDPNTGLSGFAPGWTARGYAGYSGYAWYRLRINVVQQNAQGNTQDASEALAISMPSLFDDAYQVYVDGRLAGEFGRFSYPLKPGDRLTFVSDGVVEAANEKRELFGFARTLAISEQPAHAIAEAAKQFGQQDDISVLSVTRAGARETAFAGVG